MLAACASSPGLKGGPLSAFAPEGITDHPPQRHALLVGIDHAAFKETLRGAVFEQSAVVSI